MHAGLLTKSQERIPSRYKDNIIIIIITIIIIIIINIFFGEKNEEKIQFCYFQIFHFDWMLGWES